MSEILRLFFTFFKVGAVTFGGGYAMLPILQREVVEKKGWITADQAMDFYALAQGMPGVISVNVAAFIGFHRKGPAGAAAGALGVVCPCLVIITAVAAFLRGFQDNPLVRGAFAGISVCVAALIVNTVLNLWKRGVKDGAGALVCLGVFALMVWTSISPVVLILAAAAYGLAAGSAGRPKTEKEAETGPEGEGTK